MIAERFAFVNQIRYNRDMVFKLCALASGSKGNCIYISFGETRILVDAGLSVKEITARLRAVGENPALVDAVLLTHTHSDHCRGVDDFCLKYQTEVYRNCNCGRSFMREQLFADDAPFAVGGIDIRPLALSHDTPTCNGFVLTAGDVRAAIVTDLGVVTPDLPAALADLDCLVVECNHDPDMLARSRYPYPLRARIKGSRGHLDNLTCARLIETVYSPRLTDVYLAHLSEENNTPELAYYTVTQYLQDKIDLAACRVRVALQSQVSSVFVRKTADEEEEEELRYAQAK